MSCVSVELILLYFFFLEDEEKLNIIIFGACDVLNDDVSQRRLYLHVFFLFGRLLGKVKSFALLEEACYCGQVLRLQKTLPGPVSSSLYLLHLSQDINFSASV